MGRARRARHRVRVDAPLRRRHRRRRDRELGLSRGRHGRGRATRAQAARVVRRRGPHERARSSEDHDPRTAARPAWCSTDGEELVAPLVVTAIHPKITFLRAARARRAARRRSSSDIENWKTRSGTVKINLALAELPEFTADPGFDPDIHGGAIQLLDDLELPGDRRSRRRGSARRRRVPFSDTAIPTVFDKTLAPEGMHMMSMFTQWVPAEWADEDGPRGRARGVRRPADRARRTRSRPNFKDSIMHRQIIGPHADAAGLGADRRQHLPRRADGGPAVPHAAGAGIRGLPHADQAGCTRRRAPPMPAAA